MFMKKYFSHLIANANSIINFSNVNSSVMKQYAIQLKMICILIDMFLQKEKNNNTMLAAVIRDDDVTITTKNASHLDGAFLDGFGGCFMMMRIVVVIDRRPRQQKAILLNVDILGWFLWLYNDWICKLEKLRLRKEENMFWSSFNIYFYLKLF